MKLTFLGTSHGVPSADRYCSSALLEVNGTNYLIDGGAPVAELLTQRGMAFESVRAIFTTHIHSDHTFGMLSFCSLCCWFYKKTDVDVYFTEEEGVTLFRRMIELGTGKFDEERVRFHAISSDFVYQDENIRVTAIPTRHMEDIGHPSYAYLIECEGKKLVFTGDLHGGDAADFPQIAKEEPTDLIVSEMAHFGAGTLFPILEKCPTRQVLINHIGFGTHLEDIAKALEEERFPFPLRAVNDGDELVL